MIFDKITDLIGDTPMLKISSDVHGLPNVNLYAKLEMMNPLGSVKDRVAWAMIKDDLDDLIEHDKTIVENSSGNTAKALQAIAGSFGVKFKLMTTMARVPEPKDVMRVLGAEIEELSQASTDCFDPNDPNDPQYVIERFVQQSEGKAYFPSQFTNIKNVEVHRKTTGPEIMKDLDRVDWFIGGLGTTGSTRGVIEAVRERDTEAKCLGVCAKDHDYIPGIRNAGQMWEVGLYDKALYQGVVDVSALDAVSAMVELNRECGLLCGPSAGAQYAALQKYFDEHPSDKEINVVFIACDRMEWYLSYIKKYRPDLFEKNSEEQETYSRFYPDYKALTALQVSAQSLDLWVEQQAPIIIDIRTPSSLKILSIPGAINIPESMLEDMIEKTQPFPKDKKVLFICAVGHKSLKLASYLHKRGVDAYSLEDGIVSYQNAAKKVA